MSRGRGTRKVGLMWTYHPHLLAKPVPRYTSYPAAAEFHEGVDRRLSYRKLVVCRQIN